MKKPKRVASESGPYPCEFCDRVLASKKGLKIHQRRHTGEKLRKCEVCQAQFTRTNHLRRHLQNCHIIKSETTVANDNRLAGPQENVSEMLGNGNDFFLEVDTDNSEEDLDPNVTEVILEKSETNQEEEIKVIG